MCAQTLATAHVRSFRSCRVCLWKETLRRTRDHRRRRPLRIDTKTNNLRASRKPPLIYIYMHTHGASPFLSTPTLFLVLRIRNQKTKNTPPLSLSTVRSWTRCVFLSLSLSHHSDAAFRHVGRLVSPAFLCSRSCLPRQEEGTIRALFFWFSITCPQFFCRFRVAPVLFVFPRFRSRCMATFRFFFGLLCWSSLEGHSFFFFFAEERLRLNHERR